MFFKPFLLTALEDHRSRKDRGSQSAASVHELRLIPLGIKLALLSDTWERVIEASFDGQSRHCDGVGHR